ncbi:MAG: hypothetical protein ACYDBQ_11795 [Thermoplasmatota archaeon]
MAQTSIKLEPRTRDALQELKGKHTYDELLAMFLRLVPAGDDEGPFTPEFRYMLLEAKLDRHVGRTRSLQDVKRELGL